MNVFELEATLGLNTDEYEQKLKGASESSQQAAKGVSAGTVALGNIMASVVKAGARQIVNLGKQGIEYNAKVEQYTTAITTALGGTEEAAQQAAAAIEQIKDDAAHTPFSTDGLVQANMLLLSTGETAGDARKTIMALSEAVSATGGGNAELQRMASNLQQIKNVGKASAMDIRQFAMAGIDIYGLLADYTGKTTAEVQNMTITYDMLTGALEAASEEGGRFYGANIAQSQTLNGMISALSDNVQMKLGEAFEGATDAAKKALPKIIEFVQNIDVTSAVDGFENLALGIVGVSVTLNRAKIAEAISKIKNVSAGLASPWNVFGLAVTAVAVAVKASKDAFDEAVDNMASVGETSEEVAAQMENLKAQIEAADEAAKLYGTETDVDAQRLALIELQKRYDELKAAEDAAADGAVDFADASDEVADAAAEQEAQLDELAQAFKSVYDSIQKNVQNYFKTFEEAPKIQKASIDKMIENLRSQTTFNNTYAQSIQTISDSNIEGLDGIAEALSGAGKEGAEYAGAIADAIESGDEQKVQDLVSAFNDMQSSQESLTGALAGSTSEFHKLRDAASRDTQVIQSALDRLDGKRITVTLLWNAVKNLPGGSHATGLEYVPFDGYIAQLHKGERVLTAQENRSLNDGGGVGGGNGGTVNIFTQQMDDATVDYLVERVQTELGWALA